MRIRFAHQAVLGILLICQLSICLATQIPDARNSTKYLDVVRVFSENVPKASNKNAQVYVFPDVDQMPSHEGLPDLFVMQDSSRVKTKEDWYKQRDYLKAMLAYYQYGHMPPKPKKVMVQDRTSTTIYGGKAIWTRLDLVISRKGKEVRVRAGILRPNKPGKYPVIIKNDEFLFNASEIEQPEIRRIYEGQREQIDEVVRREAIKRNYAICKFIRTDLALDELEQKDSRDAGVFPLYPKYNWGTIAAWAWGYQIVLDILEREPFVDMKKITATGHARGGKAALCAGIYDERIVITAPHVSGPGGTGSWRFFDPVQYPRGLAAVRESVSYFWVPRLFSFIGREQRLPFDAHFAKALIAPRILLNTHAREDYNTNPYGTYLTHLAAQSIFKLLGVGENCLIHWRDGSDHVQSQQDWLVLFDVCDKVFFGKETNLRFNDNPFPGLYRFDVLNDINTGGITALHDAIEKGYKVAELLIYRGVDINPKDGNGDTPLHYAVRSSRAHVGMVELLIDCGANLNAKNNEGQTPVDIALRRDRNEIVKLLIAKGADVSLHSAVRQRLLEKIKELIGKGSDINAVDSSGQTALHYAARRGHKEIVELLLANGANVNTKDNKGLTPAEMAMSRQRTQIAKLLIDNNADISSIHLAAFAGNLVKVKTFLQMGININAQDSDGRTPLHYAATADVAEFLITNGADINAEDKDGETPLHTTAAAGFKDMVELLIKNGTNVNANKSGDTPLSWAIWRNHKDVIRSLVINGADVNFKAKNDWPFLHYVVWNNDKDLVELFVTHGADVNFTPKDDYPLLHYALWKENVESVKLLVNHGAKFNTKDQDGWTAFRYVVSGGNRELLEFFVAKGAKTSDFHTAAWLGDLNQVKRFVEQGIGVNKKDDHFQWTPLHWTAFTGSKHVAEFLLTKGANVNTKDEFNAIPLHYAAQKGYQAVVELLIANGSKFNAKDNSGQMPLHYAVGQGHLEIVKLLITKGADVNAKTDKGETAISLANKKGHTEIVELLRKHAADLASTTIGSKSVRLSPDGAGGMDEICDLILTGPSESYTQYGNYPRFGDVNGDGYEDLLVAGGSRYNNNQGRVYLYYGGTNMDDIADIILTGENSGNDYETGENTGDYFGEEAYLADVNGDNYADIVTGAFGYNNMRGRLYIYFGSPAMDGDADLIIEGEAGTQGGFGGVITAGDINNDSFDDVVVSAIWLNNKRGRAYLIYGGNPMDTTVDLVFEGEKEHRHFGRDINNPKMIGDVNGDGYGDLLISSRYWNYWKRASGQGRAYLYYGGPGTSMDSIPDKTFTGENERDDFGVSGCIFDIDNDGFGDIIIGARGYNRRGRVYLYWGGQDMDTTADLTFDGEGGNFGCGLDAGYVNGNEYGDFIVAAPYYSGKPWAGRAYLFYGDTKARINTICDKTFTLPTDTDNRPQHVALGDLHNDKYPEVAIGGYHYNNGQGRVWIYFNKPPKSK